MEVSRLVQSHSDTLNLCFYDGTQFPAEYPGDIFAAFHGSWNRERRTGYKIVRVPIDKSTRKARGDYEDFVGKRLGTASWHYRGERWQSAFQRRRKQNRLGSELRWKVTVIPSEAQRSRGIP